MVVTIRVLYVIRHGLADDASEHQGQDEERQLTKKGREKVKGVARYLQAQGFDPAHLLSSPLVRARETAELIRAHSTGGKEVTITELLRPDGSYDELIAHLNSLDGDSAALVGHEPFLSGFVSYCLTRTGKSFVRMKKAGVACLGYEGPLEAGGCELQWLLGPGQMLAEE